MLCYVRLLLNLSPGPVFYVFNSYSCRSGMPLLLLHPTLLQLLFLSNVSFRSEYTSIIGLRQFRSFSDVFRNGSQFQHVLSNIIGLILFDVFLFQKSLEMFDISSSRTPASSYSKSSPTFIFTSLFNIYFIYLLIKSKRAKRTLTFQCGYIQIYNTIK